MMIPMGAAVVIAVIALLTGGSVGFILFALCSVASQADQHIEVRPEPDTERPTERPTFLKNDREEE